MIVIDQTWLPRYMVCQQFHAPQRWIALPKTNSSHLKNWMSGRLSEVSVLGSGMCFEEGVPGHSWFLPGSRPLASSIHMLDHHHVIMGARKFSNFLTYPHEGTSLIYTHLWIHVFFDPLKRQLLAKKMIPGSAPGSETRGNFRIPPATEKKSRGGEMTCWQFVDGQFVDGCVPGWLVKCFLGRFFGLTCRKIVVTSDATKHVFCLPKVHTWHYVTI